MADVGYIGLGVMGGGVAKRLLDAGHEVTGWNRTKDKARWLIDAGMGWGDTPREVAERSEVVFTMVTNTAAVQAVTDGPDGILAGLAPGKVYADMSTVSPESSRQIAHRVAELGAHMIDAPVSGSVITLEQGKLSVMVGGEEAVVERVRPILEAIGPKVIHVGPNGAAVTMKIACNLSLAVQMLAFSEGVLLAEKSGIAREKAVEVLLSSVIASPMITYRGPFVLEQPDEAWFDVNMMQKDMNLALELGTSSRCAAADDGSDERAADGCPWPGAGRQGFRDSLRRPRDDVRPRRTRPDMSAAAEPVRGTHGHHRPALARDVSRHDDDPFLRGAGRPALPRRENARPRTSLRWRRGRCRRCVFGATSRRLHHQHASRSWALSREGRRCRADVRRAPRPGAGLLPGQGRVDAHRGPREREPRSKRDRRRFDRESRPVRRSRRGVAAPTRSLSASSATEHLVKGSFTRS